MHNPNRIGYLLIASLMLLSTTSYSQEVPAQDSSTPEAAGARADDAAIAARNARTPEQAVSSYLDRKKQRQQRRDNALQRRGAGADQQELRRLYKALNIPKPSPKAQISAASETGLANSLETDSVQLLQALNFKPPRIRKLSEANLNPLQSASAFTRGTATITDYALLSDIVAVARVTDVRDEPGPDGFRSTVLLEITDSVLGRAPNKAIALRQASGKDQNGQELLVSTDLQANPGQAYLVMLSAGLYDQMAVESGGQANAAKGPGKNFVPVGPTYLVQGDTLTPVGSSEASATTLTQLKSAVAPVARARNTADDNVTSQETAQ